jgi:hypothetical protein
MIKQEYSLTPFPDHIVTTHREKDGGGTEDQPTTFEPDWLGRPHKTIFPDGSWELTTYKYEQVDEFRTRKNQTKQIFYDARGREISQRWLGDAIQDRNEA